MPVCQDCRLCVPVRAAWSRRPVDDPDADVETYTLRPACIWDPYRPLLVRYDEESCGHFMGGGGRS